MTSSSLDQDTSTLLGDTDNEDDEYHHHVNDAGEALRAKDTHQPCIALCGKLVYPKANPIAHPCCPGCKMFLKKPCITEEYR